MVQCFAPSCKHYSESHTCRFYSFPRKEKKKAEYKRWIELLRRDDKEPTKFSRVCSCHFRNGEKSHGPEIHAHNANILYMESKSSALGMKGEMLNAQPEDNSSQGMSSRHTKLFPAADNRSIEIELSKRDEALTSQKLSYTVSNVNKETLSKETGLPTKEIFKILVDYVSSFKDCIIYYYGWEVKGINFEDQIFITLMKLKQNYTNLHLAQLFSCSEETISNIVITFLYVLHDILFKDIMTLIPSRQSNGSCLPKTIAQYTSFRIIIDSTDIETANPSLINEQRATSSTNRDMDCFKVVIGVAPNAVITFVSNLYPDSISDKEIVKQSGLLDQLEAGDLILAEKEVVIQDLVPTGVSVNIPQFLEHGKSTDNEIKLNQKIASCRIQVERANSILKDFKILTFIPPYLRSHADKLVQLCAALVNLQFTHVKEGCKSNDFE